MRNSPASQTHSEAKTSFLSATQPTLFMRAGSLTHVGRPGVETSSSLSIASPNCLLACFFVLFFERVSH